MKTIPDPQALIGEVVETAEAVEQVIKSAEAQVEKRVQPLRETVGKRYPTLFILLSTFGLIATYLAMEQILLQYNITQENPFLLLICGIGILVFTGTLYKKLG